MVYDLLSLLFINLLFCPKITQSPQTQKSDAVKSHNQKMSVKYRTALLQGAEVFCLCEGFRCV